MSEAVLEVKNLCIDYRNLSHMSIHQSLMRRKKDKEDHIVHAVKDITFSVQKVLHHCVVEGESLFAQIILVAEIAHYTVGELLFVFYNE